MKRFFWIFAAVLILSSAAGAAIPPSRFIVSELVKNSGSGVYQIEQDVQIPTSGEPLLLRETWWVQSDSSLRLQVAGLRELKDQFRLNFVYSGGQRYQLGPQGKTAKKLNDDFIEKYFHYRSSERLLNDLVALKILSPASLARKNWKTVKEIEFKAEPFIRLGRSGGSINYVFGTPSAIDGNANPGFWIEQDTFVLRKFRLPSLVEVSAEKFVQSPRGLMFPRMRTVRFGPNVIQIQTLNVTPKSGLRADFFQPSSLDQPNRTDGIENPPVRALVEEFYSRFR